MHEETELLEPDDVLDLPGGESYELVDGHLVEKNVGARSEEIGGNLLAAIHHHVRPQRLGHVFGSHTAYRCFPDRPRLMRKPDVSFVARGRFDNDQTPIGDILIPPDLVAEVISPNDLFEDVETKVQEYLKAGVRLVWVISPAASIVLIRRPDKSAASLAIGDALTGEDVLPGFTLPLSELFA
jgi:Uma2 family endonuclease